jgi:5-methylcytosine-specific restriction endonuclease McrA
MENRICLKCGGLFTPHGRRRKTCSRECAKAHRLEHRARKKLQRPSRAKTRQPLPCRKCGVPFVPVANHQRWCGCRPEPRPARAVEPRKICMLCKNPGGPYAKLYCTTCAPVVRAYQTLHKFPSRASTDKSKTSWSPTEDTCDVCSADVGPKTWNRHHIVPRSQGGANNRSNLALLCEACHSWAHGSALYAGRYTGPSSRIEFAELVRLLK